MATEASSYFNVYRQHHDSTIRHFQSVAAMFLVMHATLQIMIFTGATFAAIIINFSDVPRFVPAIASGIVALSTAIVQFFQPFPNCRRYRLAAQKLQGESDFFYTGTDLYAELERKKAEETFIVRSNEIILELREYLPPPFQAPDQGVVTHPL
jgi:Protein of unknown function (DUF4231)